MREISLMPWVLISNQRGAEKFLSSQNGLDQDRKAERDIHQENQKDQTVELEKLLSRQTVQELSKMRSEYSLGVLTGVLLERLNSSIHFSDFHLRTFKDGNGQSLLAGVLSELERNAQRMVAENPNLSSLLSEWVKLEKELIDSANDPEKAQETLKKLNQVLQKGGREFLAYLLNRELIAQVTNVLSEYVNKMGALLKEGKEPPEHSVDEVIFGELNRKSKLAKALILGEKPAEDLLKNKIDDLVEKAKPVNQTPKTNINMS